MKISDAKLEVVRFAAEDVIATSIFAVQTGSGYNVFNGTMSGVYTENKGYAVSVGSSIGTWDEETFGYNVTMPQYNPLYIAYDDGSGTYYTQGVDYETAVGETYADSGEDDI